MLDPRVAKQAQILTHYCLEVKPGDRIAVNGTVLAEPLLLALQREILRAGGYPHVMARIPGLDAIFMEEANDDQLQYVSPFFQIPIEQFEGLIRVEAAANTRQLSNVDPARIARRGKAMGPVMQTYMERQARGDLRWVVTLFPTPAHAQDAEMSLREFEDYAFGAMYADEEDPVERWQEVHRQQQRLVDWLEGKREVKVQGPDVDLELSIEGRRFVNSDGRNNMPSGEIFTSPVEDSINGWIRFSYPAIHTGVEVDGIELWFENGRITKASAAKNEAFLIQALDLDPGARYLGEFAVGTNTRIDRFIGNILFDEKLGGTIHLAIGAGYPETGGRNKSAIHWDMLCDMKAGGQIIVDGDLFYESGEFRI